MPSAQENLQNLLKIGKLKAEPPDQKEFDGLVNSAGRKLLSRRCDRSALDDTGKARCNHDNRYCHAGHQGLAKDMGCV